MYYLQNKFNHTKTSLNAYHISIDLNSTSLRKLYIFFFFILRNIENFCEILYECKVSPTCRN